MKTTAAITAALALTACGTTPQPQPQTQPIQITGTLNLTGSYATLGENVIDDTTWTCAGHDGYQDLKPGGNVIITGINGELGRATLTGGTMQINPQADIHDPAVCEMTFTVPNIDPDQDYYVLTIGTREELTYTPEQITQPLQLTIGK